MTDHLPYGSWRSPVPAELLVAGASSPSDVQALDGVTWWSESRPDEGSREQIVRLDPDGTRRDLLPPGFNARSRVHEYGGGAWWATSRALYFVNYADQRLYRLVDGSAPEPVSPEPAAAHGLRYADGRLTPDGRFFVTVRERHLPAADPSRPAGGATEGPAAEVINEIVAIRVDGGTGGPGATQVLVTGWDFVAAPRISPDGGRLAWLAWDHPDMPWDGTELWVGDLRVDPAGRLTLSGEQRWAGGRDEALVQPEWGPDGQLHVVSDASDWWNVQRVPAPGVLVPVCPVEAEVGMPAWRFGQSRYQVGADGTIWFTWSGPTGAHLVEAGPEGPAVTHSLAHLALAQLRLDGGRLVAIATDALREASVVRFTPGRSADGEPAGAGTALEPEVLRPPRDLHLPEEAISRGRRIDFPSAGGRTAHAWFFPPAGDGVAGPPGERPPLLVGVHGGPTGAADPSFRLGTQFWTTRGFAVVEVDYGGSTGYGRPYRRLLDGAWGIVDVEDVCAAARWLADAGMVDGDRTAIRGGSAGGFTALAALATTDVFAAGASHYGVADLAALARDTHKFESRYLDRLVGPLPEAAHLYRERSPLAHLEGFDVPLIVLQGLLDEVVPPAQAEMIVTGLRSRGVPHAYLTFADEMHGFRMAANVVRAITAELYFYSRVFGFEPADDLEPVEIVGGPGRSTVD